MYAGFAELTTWNALPVKKLSFCNKALKGLGWLCVLNYAKEEEARRRGGEELRGRLGSIPVKWFMLIVLPASLFSLGMIHRTKCGLVVLRFAISLKRDSWCWEDGCNSEEWVSRYERVLHGECTLGDHINAVYTFHSCIHERTIV